MQFRLKYVISVLGAGALISSVLTDALASKPSPFRTDARTRANLTVTGNLRVNNVLRVDKNFSDYGRVYAHGGAQVWKTLTVKTGGLQVTGGTTTDSLTTPTLSVSQQATISGNAAVSGALTTGSLTSTGAINAASLTLSSGGKNSQIGLDGNGNLTMGGIASTGAITASSLATTGGVTAGGLTVTGNVDFSKASVTGLNFSNLNLQNLTLNNLSLGASNPNGTSPPLALTENGQTESLGVDSNGALTVRSLAVSNTFTAGAANFSALTLGSSSGTTPALTLAGNGKTTQIGVDANANLTVGGLVASGAVNATGGLTVGGNATFGGSLTVTGTGGLVTNTIAAPPVTSGSTTLGALSLTGGSIALNGGTTVSGGNDFSLSSTGTGSSTVGGHFNSGGSRDVAGVATILFGSSTYGPHAAGAATVCFTKPYNTPIVTITADGDPAPNPPTSAAPKVFVQTFPAGTSVCSTAGGFTINYTAPADATVPTSAPTIQYFYHVIGG